MLGKLIWILLYITIYSTGSTLAVSDQCQFRNSSRCGSNQADCENKNCCWNPTAQDGLQCYFYQSDCVIDGSECGMGILNPESCNRQESGCCWDGYKCVKRTGDCVIDGSECGMGILNPESCNRQESGCCWDGYKCVKRTGDCVIDGSECGMGILNPESCNRQESGCCWDGYKCVKRTAMCFLKSSDTSEKVDCGSSKEECQNKLCCWDDHSDFNTCTFDRDECNITVEDRRECGVDIRNVLDCESLGCCYNFNNSPMCYYRYQDCDVERETDCGIGLSKNVCLSHGCCVRTDDLGDNHCFRKRQDILTSTTSTSTLNTLSTNSTDIDTKYTTLTSDQTSDGVSTLDTTATTQAVPDITTLPPHGNSTGLIVGLCLFFLTLLAGVVLAAFLYLVIRRVHNQLRKKQSLNDTPVNFDVYDVINDNIVEIPEGNLTPTCTGDGCSNNHIDNLDYEMLNRDRVQSSDSKESPLYAKLT